MNYTEYRENFCISRKEWAAYRKRKKNRIYCILGLFAGILLMFAIVAIVRAITIPSFVEPKVVAELGIECDPQDFLKEGGHSAIFPEGCDTSTLGRKKIPLLVDGKKYNVTVKVVDTVAPSADVQNVYVSAGDDISPEMFVTNVVDADQVKIKFKKFPSTSVAGKQEVTVILSDSSRNETVRTASLIVIKSKATFAITIELGDPIPKPSEFTEDKTTKYLTDMSAMDFSAVGEYDLEISVEGETIPVVLIIKDTTPPRGTVKTLSFYPGAELPAPEDFIVEITDLSPVTVKYALMPDMNTTGRNSVRLDLTDSSGNVTSLDTYVEIIADVEPPVITVLKSEFIINEGDLVIPWSGGAEATDDSGWCELELDASGVDKKTPGQYIAQYVARDAAGNEAKASVRIIVNSTFVNEAELQAALESISQSLKITPEMQATDKVRKVYNYVHSKVHYQGEGSHDDWRASAYNGFAGTMYGDCFTFAACGYALLRHLGFDVILVERSPENQALAGGTHFWVLVNIGTEEMPQWYHFDATPQRMPYRFAEASAPSSQISYLMTDEQVKAYTAWRNAESGERVYYYGCDFSKYPASATAKIISPTIPEKYYGQ